MERDPLSQRETTSDWSKKNGAEVFPNLRGTLLGPSRLVDTRDRHPAVVWGRLESPGGRQRLGEKPEPEAAAGWSYTPLS